jgi:porin
MVEQQTMRADLDWQSVLHSVAGRSILLAVLAWTSAPAALAQGADSSGIPPASIATSLPSNGDGSGDRKRLADRGVTYSVMYTNDVLANVDGGSKRGTIDQGKVEGTLSIDLEKMSGWQGMSFFANVFQLHNTGRMRRDYVGGINTIAAIEAVPTTRLSELWLERKMLDGKASLRFGQLAADVEFFFSGMSAMFLQSDWATITAVNLPSGGPAYPLSTPGIRFKYEPSSNLAMLLAVFNGDPAGPGEGDEQIRNHHGLNFRVRDPALVIGELQARRNAEKETAGLATTVKVGGWGHFGQFDDQRLAFGGGLLADPNGSGQALRRRGNSGVYSVIEQQLYRPRGGDAESGISVFGRISSSPSDRNLVNFFFDSGIVFAGLVPGRPDDKFGASFMYSRFSDSVRNFDRDTLLLTGTSTPIRDFEANLELVYSAQIVPGWTFQPMATYIWHPNGDASRNAVVVGARSFLRY